jgi:hypothetical protein
MLDEKLIQEIVDFLDGRLDEQAQNQLREKLGRMDYDLAELGELKELQDKITQLPGGLPTDRLNNLFYELLDSNKRLNIRKWWKNLELKSRAPQFAYAALLLVCGWIGGYLMSGNRSSAVELTLLTAEVRQMKQMVSLSLIQNPSPVDRLRAVNKLSAAQSGEREVIDALFKSLNTDQNTNVRLAAIDALSSFIEDPNVRQGLVQSISQQKSPLAQLELADLLVAAGEKAARQPIEMLLLRNDLNIFLRRGLERNLNKLI